MKTTNPPEFEPEPEVSLASNPDAKTDATTPAAALEANPESTLRHDVYINDKFLSIFRHEDNSGALAHAFEKSLSVNDREGAAPADGLVAWFRARMEAGR